MTEEVRELRPGRIRSTSEEIEKDQASMEELKEQFMKGMKMIDEKDLYKSAEGRDMTQEDQIYVTELMDRFTSTRISRGHLLSKIYDFNDPNVLMYIMGDVVTLIENLHIALNPPPQDGFVSLTPKDNDGSEASK